MWLPDPCIVKGLLGFVVPIPTLPSDEMRRLSDNAPVSGLVLKSKWPPESDPALLSLVSDLTSIEATNFDWTWFEAVELLLF